MCLGWDSWTVHSSSSCCCHSPAADEWWPPLSDQMLSVSLWMIEMYNVSVRKDGSISFTLSSISPCFSLSYLEIHCNLSSPKIEDLDAPPPITIWILIHTFHTSVGLSLWHLSLLCVTSWPFLLVCVHHFFCLWLLAWVIMCAACAYFTAQRRRGSPPTWGRCENVIVWLCSALWHSLYSADDFSSPVRPSALSAWNQER